MESKPFNECLSGLSTVTTPAELETVLGFINAGSGDDTDPVREALKNKLEEISENPVLANNAKIRRRLKRLIQTFDPVVPEPEPAPLPRKVFNSSVPSSSSGLTSLPKDLPSVIECLNQCSTLRDVQISLDSVIIPEKSEGEHSKEFLQYRVPLKNALERIAPNESITNKILRKRIKRLIFVLSTKEEQAVLAAEQAAAAANQTAPVPKSAATKDTKTGTSSSASTASNTAEAASKAATIAFTNCLNALNSASNAVDVETAITNVSVGSEGDLGSLDVRLAVLAKLNNIVTNQAELINNAKVRRKVTRLIDSLNKTTVVTLEVLPWEIDTKPSEPVYKQSTSVSASSSKPVKVESKAQSTVAVVESTSAVVTGEDSSSSGGVVGVPLEPTIEKVLTVTTAQELEDALIDVKPESGNCASRRKLKRAIDRLLLQENISASINAKIRRRIQRVSKYLEPKTLTPEEHAAASKAAKEAAKEAAKVKKDAEKAAAKEEKANKIPYVVFVGQLSYDTTAEDIEQHFRAHNIEGPINIRMLTDKESKSKGMAFVELEGARELHKCITLHHSKIKGRVINVEKSCGGSNKENRSAKLTDKRKEQQSKVRESVDKVLEEYNENGTIVLKNMGENFRNQVYKYTPGFVADALKTLATYTPENRTFAMLDRIFQQRDDRIARAKKRSLGIEDRERGLHDIEDGLGGEEHIQPLFKKVKSNSDERSSTWPENSQPIGFGDENNNKKFGGSKRSRDEVNVVTKSSIEDVFPSRRGRGGKMM